MFEKIGYLAVGYLLYKAVASPRGQGLIARMRGSAPAAAVGSLGCGCGPVSGLSRRRRRRRRR